MAEPVDEKKVAKPQESQQSEGDLAAAAIERLLGLGRSQGYVTYDDVMEVIPEAELNIEQLEDALAALIEQGIEISDVELEEPVTQDREKTVVLPSSHPT